MTAGQAVGSGSLIYKDLSGVEDERGRGKLELRIRGSVLSPLSASEHSWLAG